MGELLDELVRSHEAGRRSVHAAVVETRGSTPQKPGAMMLVFEDGQQLGTLGGGCTEAEVKRQSLLLFDDDRPQVLRFTLDDNYGWDDGLICGGRMIFAAQKVSEQSIGYFRALRDLHHAGQGGFEAVVFDADKARRPLGTRWLFDHDQKLIETLATGEQSSAAPAITVSLADRPRPYADLGIAFIPILPRCRLVIIGAGHVGQAVASLARQVDFDVWVLDDREAYANKQRFPMASRVWVQDLAPALESFVPDANTYTLIMTRGHAHDEEALYRLIHKQGRYLGLIGSRRKIRLIFEDLEKEGVATEALDQVHAPLGFDIGSQTVPEIALSIVAHLVGHRNRGPEAFPPNGRLLRPGVSAPV